MDASVSLTARYPDIAAPCSGSKFSMFVSDHHLMIQYWRAYFPIWICPAIWLPKVSKDEPIRRGLWPALSILVWPSGEALSKQGAGSMQREAPKICGGERAGFAARMGMQRPVMVRSLVVL